MGTWAPFRELCLRGPWAPFHGSHALSLQAQGPLPLCCRAHVPLFVPRLRRALGFATAQVLELPLGAPKLGVRGNSASRRLIVDGQFFFAI